MKRSRGKMRKTHKISRREAQDETRRNRTKSSDEKLKTKRNSKLNFTTTSCFQLELLLHRVFMRIMTVAI